MYDFSPDLLDMVTILFSFDVQKDFSVIADEDAKAKLSDTNDFGDSAEVGRTLMAVLVEKVKDWTIKLSSLVLFKLSRARLCYFRGLF